MSCKREDGPAVALARAHGAQGHDDAGDDDLFAVAAPLHAGEIHGFQFLQARRVFRERMPRNVKAERGKFRGQQFVLGPFLGVGKLGLGGFGWAAPPMKRPC